MKNKRYLLAWVVWLIVFGLTYRVNKLNVSSVSVACIVFAYFNLLLYGIGLLYLNWLRYTHNNYINAYKKGYSNDTDAPKALSTAYVWDAVFWSSVFVGVLVSTLLFIYEVAIFVKTFF